MQTTTIQAPLRADSAQDGSSAEYRLLEAETTQSTKASHFPRSLAQPSPFPPPVAVAPQMIRAALIHSFPFIASNYLLRLCLVSTPTVAIYKTAFKAMMPPAKCYLSYHFFFRIWLGELAVELFSWGELLVADHLAPRSSGFPAKPSEPDENIILFYYSQHTYITEAHQNT